VSGVWLRARDLLGAPGASGLTTREIATTLDVEAGEVGRVMRLMEKRGHIARAADAEPTRWIIANRSRNAQE